MRPRRAFTLFETVITVIVLSLLVTISYVGYTAVIRRTKESGAQAVLHSFVSEAQTLWIADRSNASWENALTRAAADLPDDKGWTFTLTDDVSPDERTIVGEIAGNRVGLAVREGERFCYATVAGAGSVSVGCALPWSAEPTVVAGLRADWQAPTPRPGWSYLWTSNGVPGESSGYAPLLGQSATVYQQDVSQLLPRLDLGAGGIEASPGANNRPGATGHGPVMRWTANRDGAYSIVDSVVRWIANGCGYGDGVEARVYVNDQMRRQVTTDTVAVDYDIDVALGELSTGDRVDVYIEPRVMSDCDGTLIDYSIMWSTSAAAGTGSAAFSALSA